MVKKTSTRKNNRRKSRGRITRPRRVSEFPPAIPFNACFMDVVLRHVTEYPSQAINSRIDKAIAVSDLFDGVWAGLGTTFSQVRIKKIHLYAQSGVGFSERGYHAINLAPKVEFEITENTKFSTLATLPGTKMARITRLVSGLWYPTGPDERLWTKTDSKAALMDFTYMSDLQKSDGAATATSPLVMTMDAHVRLRGINYSKLKGTLEQGDELDAEFVNLAT